MVARVVTEELELFLVTEIVSSPLFSCSVSFSHPSPTISSTVLLSSHPSPFQQVPITRPLSIPPTSPAWLGSSDLPMSQNPPCHLPLALHHHPTLTILKRRTLRRPLPLLTRHLEIGWDLLPTIPTQGSLSTGPWPRHMVSTLPCMTAGEYGDLR